MIRFIHLSDLHLISENPSYEQKEILNTLIEDLGLLLKDKNVEPILLITGDLVDKGGFHFKNKARCYDEVNKLFFIPLLKKFSRLQNRIFFIPGNHDVDRKLQPYHYLEFFRDSLPENFNDEQNNDSPVMMFAQGSAENENQLPWLKNYFKFQKEFYKNYPSHDKRLGNLVTSFKLKIKEKTFGISCFNTAWLCDGNEKVGSLFMPDFIIDSTLNYLDGVDKRICIMHHPFHMFFNQERFKAKIEKEYDFLFRGHIHDDETRIIESKNGSIFKSVSESTLGVGSTLGKDQRNGYKIIDYNIKDEELEVYYKKYVAKGRNKKREFRLDSSFGVENGKDTFGFSKSKNSTSQIVEEGLGFINKEIDVILQETIEYLSSAQILRVIGIGRQYLQALNNSEKNLTSDYYRAIEDRLSKKSKKQFTCRRMTIMELEEHFIGHLRNCFIKSEGTNNKMELLFLDDFDMRMTYYIIDDRYIVFNLYNKTDNNILDCLFSVCSKNKNIIEQFVNHFDSYWSTKDSKDVITKYSDIDKILPFDKDIVSNLGCIKKSIQRFPRSSMRMKRALTELLQAKERLRGLENYHLDIEYKIDNGKMLTIFCDCMKELKNGGSYCAVSFIEFWKNIYHRYKSIFFEENKNALIRGALIERVFIINRGKMNDIEYIDLNKDVLQSHYELTVKFKNLYYFKLLFVDEREYYEKYLNQYENFALWENGNEKILFKGVYSNTPDSSTLTNSEIYYIEDDADYSTKTTNISEYDNRKALFEDVKKIQRHQVGKLQEEDLDFILKCGLDKTLMHD